MRIGKIIVAAFILFGAFLGVLVTLCLRQDVSLVSKQYYQEEVRFQEQIDRMENASALLHRPLVTLNGRTLILSLRQHEEVTSGKMVLFRPSDARLDRVFELEARNDPQSFALDGMASGMYRVKLEWTMNNREYYQEHIIHI